MSKWQTGSQYRESRKRHKFIMAWKQETKKWDEHLEKVREHHRARERSEIYMARLNSRCEGV